MRAVYCASFLTVKPKDDAAASDVNYAYCALGTAAIRPR